MNVQFWSEIKHLISNWTHVVHSFDFEIMHMISDQIALHSIQLPLPSITLLLRILGGLMRIASR